MNLSVGSALASAVRIAVFGGGSVALWSFSKSEAAADRWLVYAWDLAFLPVSTAFWPLFFMLAVVVPDTVPLGWLIAGFLGLLQGCLVESLLMWRRFSRSSRVPRVEGAARRTVRAWTLPSCCRSLRSSS